MQRRTALGLTAAVVLAQLLRLPALVVVEAGTSPESLSLSYPVAHIVFAPLTLLADWLNGGSRAELAGFFGWAIIAWIAARAVLRGPVSRYREALYAAAFVLSLVAFSLWLVYLPRSIPRLVAQSDRMLIFDIHSHTSESRDGRAGFGIAANARWHERAGFHAAFITDHNVFGAVNQWRLERDASSIRLLNGEELSLRGLHVIVLGNHERINNEPWNDAWDSTLQLLRAIAGRSEHQAVVGTPYLIASLPEYYRHHWGPDIGRIVEAGIEGFEIWTTSPKGMEIPDAARQDVIERARLERLGLFGATDMHGIGHTASVWNVTAVGGWRAMNDSALTNALIAGFRSNTVHNVVALRRYIPQSRAGSLFAVPLGVLTTLRTASFAHSGALLLWIWVPALWMTRRRPQSLP